MRFLLDTHVALWAIVSDGRLPARARAIVEDDDNDLLVSVASLWEISIKFGLGRNRPNAMPVSGPDALGYVREAGYELLDVKPEHAIAIQDLPPLHADPFDRLIVAQALVEPLRLITHDKIVASYSDAIILV